MSNPGHTRSIAFSSLKGGGGKSTLAFNLAERAWSSSLRTAVLDYDTQEANFGLSCLRGEDSWPVFRQRVGVPGADYIAALKNTGEYDFLICDLPGSDSMTLGRLLMQMDLVLCPIGYGAPDLQAADNFSWMIKPMDLPSVFIGSRLPAGQYWRRQLQEETKDLGVELCPVIIQQRMAHARATRSGRGVCEMFPKSPAAREVNDLWNWVRQRVGI